VSYPEISEAELRRRLTGLGHEGKDLDLAVEIWRESGMTVDEVLHVKWGDIDRETGTLRVPDLSSRVYRRDEAWLQARAFAPGPEDEEEGKLDRSALPESSLERVLPRERPELLELFEPNRGLSRELDVFGQAILVGWLELAARLSEDRLSAELADYCAEIAADGYSAAGDDPDRFLTAVGVGATVNGVLEDLRTGGEARLQDLADLFAGILGAFDKHPSGNAYGEAGVLQQVMLDVLQSGYDPIEMALLFAVVPAWQRLLWLAECAYRRGAVVAPGRGEPLVGDEDEQLTYLIRLGGEQPGLAGWPELARFIPRRADGLLPMTEAAYQRFRKDGIGADHELSVRLAEEIVHRRHYALSSVSVIELEELGIRRIVLTPEEQPLAAMTGNQAAFHLGFFVDHVAGGFYGRAQTFAEPLAEFDNRRALVTAPAILEQAAVLDEETAGAHANGRKIPPAVEEAIAAVELIVLAAWRDLVVPEVRDQHFEIDRVRKVKGGNRKRAAKRGDVEIIRYIPRRLIMMREERERVMRTGEHTLRRLYPVGGFSRRLPEGQRRSKTAEAFAAESGIPLKPWQTVVQPHWRGGTPEEREHAAADPELDVRHWRSWSALDLLRTRLASRRQ
jgi:hypothetical protein